MSTHGRPREAPGTALPAGIGRPATAALSGTGIRTLEQVACLSERELLQLHGVGPKAVRLLTAALRERGLTLAAPPTDSATARSAESVLVEEAEARIHAWTELRRRLDLPGPDAEIAALVGDDAAAHTWREVDAALDRRRCDDCETALGAGRRGCAACDAADGGRFAAIERDRPGVPPGNEHALRVATVVVRHPHRWPEVAVTADRSYLPLFAAGDLPTKTQRYALLAAVRAGLADRLAGAGSFTEMAQRAERLRTSSPRT